MNTRITVPLSQEAYDAVTLLAKIGGISRGKFLAETLEAAIPSFLTVAAAYRAAMAVEGEERAQLVAGMAEAERHLMAAIAESVPQIIEGDRVAAAAPLPREGSAGAERPADPRLLTGGFTTSETRKQGQ